MSGNTLCFTLNLRMELYENGIVSVRLGSKLAFCFFFLGFCFRQCQLHITKPDRNNENLAGDFASRDVAEAS